jgi:threonine dehydratase
MQLYNTDAIVLEPAGALSVAALGYCKDDLKGKNIVCVISGGNNDIQRMPDIKERSLIFEGLKHFFIIKFPQRAGALKEFVTKVLSENEDITLFEYTKKNSKESGPALVGIELRHKENYDSLLQRMKKYKVDYMVLKDDPLLFNFLV